MFEHMRKSITQDDKNMNQKHENEPEKNAENQENKNEHEKTDEKQENKNEPKQNEEQNNIKWNREDAFDCSYEPEEESEYSSEEWFDPENEIEASNEPEMFKKKIELKIEKVILYDVKEKQIKIGYIGEKLVLELSKNKMTLEMKQKKKTKRRN